MIQEALYTAHVVITALATAATLLLGFLFYNLSVANRDQFTTAFLKLLSVTAVIKAYEILTAMYRSMRIDSQQIPNDASIAAMTGRAAELVLYIVTIWFLLRPETKKALNGATQTQI